MPENTASLLSRPCGSRPRLTAPQAVQAAQAVRSPATTAFGAGQAAPGLRPLRLASHLALCLALRLAALRMTIERLALRRQRHGLRPGGMVAPCAGTPVGDLPAFPGALRAGVVVAPPAPSAGHPRALPDAPGARPVLRARNSFLHDEKPAMSPRRLRPRRALLACLALAGGALLASTAPAADARPAKPIQLVIPHPPGGSPAKAETTGDSGPARRQRRPVGPAAGRATAAATRPAGGARIQTRRRRHAGLALRGTRQTRRLHAADGAGRPCDQRQPLPQAALRHAQGLRARVAAGQPADGRR